MKASDFERLFEQSISAWLSWPRVEAGQWPTDVSAIASGDEIGGWYLPWYVDQEGQSTAWDGVGARPLRVREARLAVELDAQRAARVDSIARAMRDLGGPVQLILATYALPGGAHLVLDGGHRLCACLTHDLPFVGLAVTIWGPIKRGVLPDLVHWGG